MGINQKPSASVILPVWNGERFLGRAIESVLEQTFKDFEFIIIDDGSDDKTAEILRGFTDPRIRILHHEKRLGITHALQKGLDSAKAPIIFRMDADDISLKNRFQTQMDYLNEHPAVGVVSCLFNFIDENEKTIRTFVRPSLDPDVIRWNLLFRNYLGGHAQAAFRSELAKSVGGYDLNVKFSQDYSLWTRMAEKSEIHILPDLLLLRRLHEKSAGRTSVEKQKESSLSISKASIKDLTGHDFKDSQILGLRDFMSSFHGKQSLPKSLKEIENLEQDLRLIENGKWNNEKIRTQIALQYWRLAFRFTRSLKSHLALDCMRKAMQWEKASAYQIILERVGIRVGMRM